MAIDGSNNLATLFATPAWPTPGLCSAFSALGSALLLQLDAADGFKAELVRAAVLLCCCVGMGWFGLCVERGREGL